MKKISSLTLVLLLLFCSFSFFGCGERADIVVGICNYVDDASLNQIEDNIVSELKDLAAENGKSIDIKIKNCQGDMALLGTIVSGFIDERVDLMIGIATPVAMVMQAKTLGTDIPVVFAAVSDPVDAGIVESLENPGANVTGTSDYLDTTAIMNLIFAVDEDADKIGLLYDNGQDASKSAIDAAKAYLTDKGVAFVERTGSTAQEIALAADSLITDGVDAVFTPTDNSIMTAELAIYEKFADAKIPHYAGADSFALNGAFIGYGVKYDELGKETAKLAGQILFEGKTPAEIPVMRFDNGTATVNTEICEAIGLRFEDVKNAIEPHCNRVETIVTAEDFE